MSQYDRMQATSGRNQYGITPDDIRNLREQLSKNLRIEFHQNVKGKEIAIVENFPGLDAELSEHELRTMAAQLLKAADDLSSKNK